MAFRSIRFHAPHRANTHCSLPAPTQSAFLDISLIYPLKICFKWLRELSNPLPPIRSVLLDLQIWTFSRSGFSNPARGSELPVLTLSSPLSFSKAVVERRINGHCRRECCTVAWNAMVLE